MGSKTSISSLISGITLFLVFFLHGVGEANSFPFRSVAVGDKMPAVSVKSLADQQIVSFEQFRGKPLLMAFFGADIPAKKARAIKALKVVHDLASFLEAKGVVALVVNAQGDSDAVINEVAVAAGLASNIYADIDQRLYGDLGIFVMPSFLLVAADGTLVTGNGYSRDLPKRLKGEIEVMLGEKTMAQVEEELHPKMVEKSAEEKGANRHYNLGLTMIERGQPESAIRELEKAVALEPGMGKAYVHLGCLQLDDGKINEAKSFLAKGMELEPDDIVGQVCQARIKAAEGGLDGAIEDIGFLMLRNSRNAGLHYVLGTMLETKLNLSGAMKEYRKAYELLERKSHNQ